jgi:hypothetical protein
MSLLKRVFVDLTEEDNIYPNNPKSKTKKAKQLPKKEQPHALLWLPVCRKGKSWGNAKVMGIYKDKHSAETAKQKYIDR